MSIVHYYSLHLGWWLSKELEILSALRKPGNPIAHWMDAVEYDEIKYCYVLAMCTQWLSTPSIHLPFPFWKVSKGNVICIDNKRNIVRKSFTSDVYKRNIIRNRFTNVLCIDNKRNIIWIFSKNVICKDNLVRQLYDIFVIILCT